MSFLTVELSINLGGGSNEAEPEKCKTGGSYICSGPTRGCNVPAVANDIAARTCIGTSFKDAGMQQSASRTPVTTELLALRSDLEKLLTRYSKK
jgi:hypothetical protein